MKRLILASAAALATVTMMGTANAADIMRRQPMPMNAPAYYAPYYAPYNWTGFYVGINGGGGWGNSEWSSLVGSTGSFDVSGGLVGGTIGYNWQLGQWVFGLEGDIDWSDIRGSTSSSVCAGTSCETVTTGWALDAFALVMRLIASCPTLPAVSPSAMSRHL